MKTNSGRSDRAAMPHGSIMAGLCLVMIVACLDSTVVTTCGPVIVADLNGEDIYSWILTSYLLCETIMIPIAGKLSDLYGRRPFFIIGLGLFAVGSVLCGICTSMEMFIACRAIQGLGGGILIPVAVSSVGDLYRGTERARMQGLLSAMFGIGSGIGPLLGGYMTEYTSWHWVFFVNVPLVAICAVLVLRGYPKVDRREDVRIDYGGIAILTLFLLDLLLLLEWGGDEFEWASAESAIMMAIAIVLMAIAIVLMAVFIIQERRATDPVLSPRLIRNPVVLKSAVFMFVFGFAMMGANTYIAYIGVNVLDFTVLQVGQYAMAVVAGMLITSTVSGAVVDRTGYRVWVIVGPLLAGLGLILMSVIDTGSSLAHILVSLFLFGLGLGCIMSVVMIAVQESSDAKDMGMTTSSVNLVRNIGSTTGTAVFTMIINNLIASNLDGLVPGTLTQEICDMLPHDTSIVVAAKLPYLADISDALMGVFVDSFETLFLIAAAIVLCLIILGIFYKGGKLSGDRLQDPGSAESMGKD